MMEPMNPGLVEAAQAGDARAWAELVCVSQDLAMAVAVSHAPWDDASDAAQEAFAPALVHLGELRDPSAFPGWFATVVRTACSRRSRKATRRHRDARQASQIVAADLARPAVATAWGAVTKSIAGPSMPTPPYQSTIATTAARASPRHRSDPKSLIAPPYPKKLRSRLRGSRRPHGHLR